MSSSALLTLDAVCRRYSVSRVSVWTWRREGRFPHPLVLPGGRPRWREADLEKWERQLSSRRVPGPAPEEAAR